jgi:ABC-type Fe3+ transport system substrate-binding protein
MVVGDAYVYHQVAAKRKNAEAPAAVVETAPFLAAFGGIGMNRQTEHPYATALFVDWILSDESQSYLAAQLRGPVTLKHPYLKDDAQFVIMPNLPKETIDPLVAEWRRDIEGVH